MGHACAQFNFGCMLLEGKGVAVDRKRALGLFIRSARQKNAKAMTMIGRYLEEGWGRPPNIGAAFRWYRRSASAGDFRGQFYLAKLLLEQNLIDDAEHWLELSIGSATPEFPGTYPNGAAGTS